MWPAALGGAARSSAARCATIPYVAGAFGRGSIDVKCPECGRSISVMIGDARKSPTVTCPNGHRVKLDASGLDSGLNDVQKSIDRFMK